MLNVITAFDILAALFFAFGVVGAPRFFTITSSEYEEQQGARGIADIAYAVAWVSATLISLYHLGQTTLAYLG